MERSEMTLLKWQLWLTLLFAAIALLAAPLGVPKASVVGVLGMLLVALGLLAVASAQAALASVAPPIQRLLVAAFFWLRRPAFLLPPLIVAAFFLVFEPMHVPEAPPPTIQEWFAFESSQPLVEEGPDQLQKLEDKRSEIQQRLLNEGPREAEWLDRVEVRRADTVRVKVIALDQEESEAYRTAITQVLSKHYPTLREVEPEQPQVEREEDAEPPLLALGRLEFHQPTPHINLGLDLRGGTQIVLRCLPSTTYPFQAGEGEPFYDTEGTPEQLKQRTEALEKELHDYLSAQQFPEPYFARVISPNLIEVSTRTESEEEVAQRAQTLQQYFQEHYPKATMGEAEQLLLEEDSAEKVKKIVDKRVDGLGVAETTIEVQGRDRLVVEIPDIENIERVINLINTPALLEFRLVPKQYKLNVTETPEGEEVREWYEGSVETGSIVSEEQVMAEAERWAVGKDLIPNSTLSADSKRPGSWAVSFELRKELQKEFYLRTRTNVGRYLAILLDRKVVMAPVIEQPLHGKGVITGGFDEKEAQDLKLLLNGGALPVPIEVALNQTISPTLGEDTIHKSIRAGILGLCLVVLFMIAYYRLPGALADVALAIYVLLVLAVYGFIGAALTLPGIAALVLSVGMAVDANVIIFERLKEELGTQKTMQSAVEAGFGRAWTAILDANVTTLLVAGVLYILGDRLGLSPIRGFAVTLSIGIACSLFTAITVTRLLLNMAITSPLADRRWLFQTGASAWLR
ncbi:MAG: protein translocase subunit SecD [Armatimonadota bacterium]